MNFSTMSLAYTGSVACTRRKTSPLRGIALYRSFKLSFALLRRRGLGPLRAILRTSLLAILHGRRAPVRWSAPAGCGRRREYKSSLQWHSSGEHAPLCAVPSSVSSASACTRECTRRASPDIPPAPATSSSSGPLHVPSLPVAKTSAQSSLYRAYEFSRLSQGAHTKSRERSPVLKGLLRIRRYHQQETPYALQEVERLSWLQFGEAYSALRGWRPIPAALLSHSVLLCSGTEDNSLPTH